MIEKIEWQGEIIALIVRAGFNNEGANFVTDEDSTLQVGILKHPRGFKIKPHIHRASHKIINSIQEVLHIEYGRVKVDFYDANGNRTENTILNMGDSILLIAGGHGFDILEDSKIIEVKQGPYEGTEKDKERFEIGGG